MPEEKESVPDGPPWFILPWTYPHAGWRRLALVSAPFVGLVVYLICEHSLEMGEDDSRVSGFFGVLLGAQTVLCGRELVIWVRRGFAQEKGSESAPKM